MSAARRRASLDRISCLLDVELKRIYARGTADVMAANCRQLGLPMTILTLPLTGEDNSLPPPSASQSSHYAASSRGSDEYEDYDKASTARRHVRLLYDFDPKHEDEIPIRAGQCVLVEDRIGDDWLVGHVISDPNFSESQVVPGSTPATGRFPTTYCCLPLFFPFRQRRMESEPDGIIPNFRGPNQHLRNASLAEDLRPSDAKLYSTISVPKSLLEYCNRTETHYRPAN
ncbi:unnamed protein product [Caenorhabditis auriculariae]|uniref:SH3 domain-containing protein n=1 Tax=Caenorhabditis auriculariae TaxID=2777116 RepID=A0A8S1HZZ0_9PELO|nr:unnamed protein product [Caenorhabditis auriculariae]